MDDLASGTKGGVSESGIASDGAAGNREIPLSCGPEADLLGDGKSDREWRSAPNGRDTDSSRSVVIVPWLNAAKARVTDPDDRRSIVAKGG